MNDLIAAKERELAKVSRYKQSIYQDWKDGEITRQEYHFMKADYDEKMASLTDALASLTAERDELAKRGQQRTPCPGRFYEIPKHQHAYTGNPH